jgi:hypothetical protein
VKESLKPRAYKQSKSEATPMMACLLKNEPASYSSVARLSMVTCGAGAKASLNRAIESQGVDAKPSDLPLGRLKVR